MYNFAMQDNYELMSLNYGNNIPEYESFQEYELDDADDFDDEEESEEAKIYRMIEENILREKQDNLRAEHELLLSIGNIENDIEAYGSL